MKTNTWPTGGKFAYTAKINEEGLFEGPARRWQLLPLVVSWVVLGQANAGDGDHGGDMDDGARTTWGTDHVEQPQ